MTKISIGLPIYNEERFIENRLKNILSQTYSDFEIIISDNASTDSTQLICDEFIKQDKRIKYFRQAKNQGWLLNFKNTLHYATGEYFIWTAADDLWESNFLEIILQQLESSKDIVCSIGKIKIYDKLIDNGKINTIEVSQKQYIKNFRLETITGSYADKVYQILHNASFANYLYGLFRTEILKKTSDHMFSLSWDRTLILKIAKYGTLHTTDESFWYRYPKGMSMVSIIDQYRYGSIDLFQMFFPYSSFIKWCLKNLDTKTVIANLGVFIRLSLSGFIAISIAIFKHKNYAGGKKTKW